MSAKIPNEWLAELIENKNYFKLSQVVTTKSQCYWSAQNTLLRWVVLSQVVNVSNHGIIEFAINKYYFYGSFSWMILYIVHYSQFHISNHRYLGGFFERIEMNRFLKDLTFRHMYDLMQLYGKCVFFIIRINLGALPHGDWMKCVK